MLIFRYFIKISFGLTGNCLIGSKTIKNYVTIRSIFEIFNLLKATIVSLIKAPVTAK